MKIEDLQLSNTAISCYTDCPYKYYLSYVRRLEPLHRPDYFTWGSLVHEAFEHIHSKSIKQILEHLRQSVDVTSSLSVLNTFENNLATLEGLLAGYFLRYLEDDKKYEPVGIEREFSFRLPCGATLRGKIDGLVRNIDTGEVLILERKTAKTVGDKYWEDVSFDSQIKTYCLAAREAIGFNVNSVLYDVYIKPGIRKRVSESDFELADRTALEYTVNHKKYFERRIIKVSDSELEEHFWTTDNIAKEIFARMQDGKWPKYHSKNRYSPCAFANLCKHGEQTEYELFFTTKKKELEELS